MLVFFLLLSTVSLLVCGSQAFVIVPPPTTTTAYSSSSSPRRELQQQRRTTSSTTTTVIVLYNVLSEVESDNNEQQQQRRFMYMTAEQDQLLKEKGDYEESLMKKPIAVKPHKVRGGAGGFGGGKNDKKKAATKQDMSATTIASYAKALATDGVVRIDHVVPDVVADAMRDYLVDLRARATAQIEKGEISDSQQRFADVLLNQNRCDLKIPLGPEPVHATLHALLAESVVSKVVEHVFDSFGGQGNQATLWELNCFMSNSGARRQLVHADCVCLEPVVGLQEAAEPILLTCFVALQDIDKTMGPTVWMPGTHTLAAHNRFFETAKDAASTKTNDYSPKDQILQSSKAIVGTLPKGSCVIFDPRVLHCAGANTCADPTKTRALFYTSFKNPKVDSPGCPSTSGYGIATADLTLQELIQDLKAEKDGQVPRRLPLLSHFP